MPRSEEDALNFAGILSSTRLPKDEISIGNFKLRGSKGVTDTIQYNREEWQLLGTVHEYTFPLLDGNLQLSLQLYENTRDHYRLFCYSKYQDVSGMLFSINLTTEKEADGLIFLTQKLKFSDRHEGNEALAKQYRRMKQVVFVSLLRKLKLEVTDTNDLILGIFDTKTNRFLNTTSETFLNDFIMVSLLKGHFMGNKGYRLEIMPSYSVMNDLYRSNNGEIVDDNISKKIREQSGSRSIALSLRFKVLERDNGKCKLCGKTPNEGVKLHVDNIIPFSLGGLTVLDNLQTDIKGEQCERST